MNQLPLFEDLLPKKQQVYKSLDDATLMLIIEDVERVILDKNLPIMLHNVKRICKDYYRRNNLDFDDLPKAIDAARSYISEYKGKLRKLREKYTRLVNRLLPTGIDRSQVESLKGPYAYRIEQLLDLSVENFTLE